MYISNQSLYRTIDISCMEEIVKAVESEIDKDWLELFLNRAEELVRGGKDEVKGFLETFLF